MAKGYIVADIHVRDKEGFEKFREMALPVVEEYGAKILVRTPNAEAREGKKSGVVVVIEFESMDKARKFYRLARSKELRSTELKRLVQLFLRLKFFLCGQAC